MDEGQRIYGTFNLGDEIARFPPDPDSAARHRAQILIKTQTMRVVLVTMLEGGALQSHTAPGPITVQVLRGRIDFSVGSNSNVMGEGELISLAPGVRHDVRGLEECAFLLTIGVMTRTPDPGGNETATSG